MEQGRLKSEQKAPEVVQYIMAPFLSHLSEYFDVHLRIHQAHVVMLTEQALLRREEGGVLLDALLAMEAAGQQGLDADPNTDLYMQMERFVTARAGELGGKMHMGRSRNDLYASAARMMTRAKLLTVLSDAVAFQRTLLEKATEHAATVMPGYTHMQHAEPITFGHYLLGVHDAIARDIDRLWHAYAGVNRNALGAAALAGSSFALDRDRTADLLGFDGVVENSSDAVASRDYVLESVSALAILCTNIARLTDHFVLWCTSEFAMVDLPDAYGYTSSIMPQKRNPGYFLESVRSRSARVTGHLMSALATVKGTTFAHSRDMSYEITVPAYEAFDEARAMLNVMRGVVAAVQPQRDTMLANCAGEFSGTTELANAIVREADLPFRSAYKVVATLVREAVQRHLRPSDISAALLDEIAQEVLGKPVSLSEQQVRAALDPALNVEMKQTAGGPSRSSVDAMLKTRGVAGQEEAARLHGAQLALRQADERLAAAIAAIRG